MRRGGPFSVVAAGLFAASAVAVASASATPRESANAYLPAGEAPAAANWDWTGGDVSDTAFSQLEQINSSNVASLKVAWSGS